MNILTELNQLLTPILPVETGVFSGKAPDEYVVITPMADVFELHADNAPQAETQEARLSLFSKGNYIQRKNQIVSALLAHDFTITARLYNGFDGETNYHGYTIDVAQNYELGGI
jgi:hypothetical protein